MKQRKTLVVVLLLWAGVGAVAARTADPSRGTGTRKNPVPLSVASAKNGQAVFAKYCAFCHGAQAKGNGTILANNVRPPDLTDDQWTHGQTDGDIFTVIQHGAGESSSMKPFAGKLSERDIWNVVNYLRSLRPKQQ